MREVSRTDPLPEAPADAATSTRALLSFAPVRNLLGYSFAVNAGILLQATALGKQVYDITGRELDIGLLGLAEFLPAALLVLVTGSVADRFDRRIVGSIATFGEVCCAIGLALFALTEPTSVWPLFLLAALFGVTRAFAAPATRSMPPMVAPEGALPRTIALYTATWTSAAIVGPVVGGILYAVHPSWAYWGAAMMVAVGLWNLMRVRFLRQPEPPAPGDKVSLHSALEGLRFIKRTPILFASVSLDLFAVLFGGAIALLPAIAEERLGVGDVAYGWLRAAPGIGAGIMAFVLASRPVTRHVGRWLLAVVALFGVGTMVLGLTSSYAVAFLSLILLTAADQISVYIRGTLVPLLTPDDKRGRVLAVENVFIGASNELGAFESGVAAQAFGTQFAVVGGGAATVGIVAAYSVFFPTLRRIDTFEEIDPARE